MADNLNILNVARLIENNPEVLTSDITRKFRSANKNLIFASPATAREEGLFWSKVSGSLSTVRALLLQSNDVGTRVPEVF